jgi:hypothetical protein
VRHKIDLGAALVALGAVALVISLFLHWYGPRPLLTAFDAFEVVDWLLAALALVALAGLGRAIRDSSPTPPWLPAVVLGAAFLVAAEVIDPPPVAHGATREVGAWLALGSAVAMLAGLALTAASISVTVDVRNRERRRRVPAVDRRAEPAAAATPAPPAASSVPPVPPRPSATPAPPPPPRRADPERTQPLRPLEPRSSTEPTDE